MRVIIKLVGSYYRAVTLKNSTVHTLRVNKEVRFYHVNPHNSLRIINMPTRETEQFYKDKMDDILFYNMGKEGLAFHLFN